MEGRTHVPRTYRQATQVRWRARIARTVHPNACAPACCTAAYRRTRARVHACKCSRMYTHACTHVRTHRLTVHFVLKAPRSKHLAGIQTLVRTCATKWPAGTRTGPHLGGLKRCTTRHGPMMLTGLVPSVPLIPQADSHESNSPSMKDFGRVRRPCAMSYR